MFYIISGKGKMCDMKISPIKTLIAGMLMSGMVSCEKPVLKKTAYPMLSKETMEVVDSFAREGKKIVNNPEYKCYAVDTVGIESYMSSKDLGEVLSRRANMALPLTKVGEKFERRTKLCGMVVYNDIEKVDVKLPDYIEPKAVIDNSAYYSYSTFDKAHVPVKYYGKPNPELK